MWIGGGIRRVKWRERGSETAWAGNSLGRALHCVRTVVIWISLSDLDIDLIFHGSKSTFKEVNRILVSYPCIKLFIFREILIAFRPLRAHRRL